MIPVTLQKYYIRPKETGDWLEGSEIWGAGRIVAHTEVIPERHSLAAESEFSSEIATSNAYRPLVAHARIATFRKEHLLTAIEPKVPAFELSPRPVDFQ